MWEWGPNCKYLESSLWLLAFLAGTASGIVGRESSIVVKGSSACSACLPFEQAQRVGDSLAGLIKMFIQH